MRYLSIEKLNPIEKRIINWIIKHRSIETKKYGQLYISDKDIDIFLRIYVYGETAADISKETNTCRQRQANRTSHIFYQIRQNTRLTNSQIKESFLMVRFFPMYKKYCRKKDNIIYVPMWKRKKIIKEMGNSEFYQMVKLFNIKILRSSNLIDDNLFLKIANIDNISGWQIGYLLGGEISKYEDSRGTVHTYCLHKVIQLKLQKHNIKLKPGLQKYWQDEDLVREKAIKNNIRPNKFEEFVRKNTFGKLRYTGDFSFFIQLKSPTINPYQNRIQYSKNPDFVNEEQKKVVELFGEHCHSKEEADWLIKEYILVGWDCLIIWYKEYLNDSQEMLNKIYKFINFSKKI